MKTLGWFLLLAVIGVVLLHGGPDLTTLVSEGRP